MSGEPFNSERQQAEQLDEWITAAQEGGPPQNDTVAELQRLVQIGRTMRADETFAHQLESQLTRLHRRKRRVEQWRWPGMAAAVILVIFLTVSVILALRPGEQPRPTEITPGTTPVALAATSTLAVAINLTQNATPTVLPTNTATTTVTPTPPPSATLPPGTPMPSPLGTSPRLSDTPIPAAATIVPAVNPTTMPGFPSAQVDVLFLVDTSTGITELKNGIADLFGLITSLPGQPDIRFGLLTMDEDSVQTIDFTHNVDVFLAALQEVEVVENDTGVWSVMLNEAVAGMGWRNGAKVKLIIGVADARPDEDYEPSLQVGAAQQGIVINMITLGEVDEQEASIYREMTRLTGGQFVMLANSGYTLNEWIVQLIAGELTARQSG